MKNIFWTSIFWLLLVAAGLFYIKAYDTTTGTQVANRLASVDTTTSGTQDTLLSGMTLMQTNLEELTAKMDAVSSKLWISAQATGTVLTGAVVEVLTGAKK